MPIVSFLARIGRRREGTGRNCPVVSRNRQGQSGVDRDTGKERAGNAEGISTPLLRDLSKSQSLNESVLGGCERVRAYHFCLLGSVGGNPLNNFVTALLKFLIFCVELSELSDKVCVAEPRQSNAFAFPSKRSTTSVPAL